MPGQPVRGGRGRIGEGRGLGEGGEVAAIKQPGGDRSDPVSRKQPGKLQAGSQLLRALPGVEPGSLQLLTTNPKGALAEGSPFQL